MVSENCIFLAKIVKRKSDRRSTVATPVADLTNLLKELSSSWMVCLLAAATQRVSASRHSSVFCATQAFQVTSSNSFFVYFAFFDHSIHLIARTLFSLLDFPLLLIFRSKFREFTFLLYYLVFVSIHPKLLDLV